MKQSTELGRLLFCGAMAIPTLVFASHPAMAQVGQGSITGVVEDVSEALVPNATITLTDTANGAKRTAKSDSKGFFSFVNLPATVYSVRIDAPGFAPIARSGIALHIADHTEVSSIRLAPSTDSQSVTVTSDEADIAPTTSGEQSYTLSSKQIENLNIEGRSAIELLGLVPGAANSGNFNSSSYQAPVAGFEQNSSAFSVNGNRFDQVAIVSDGAPVADVQTSGASAVTPNVEMIAESKIQTSAFSSDQPNGPIVVQTETKSGGSHFHGEAYLTARNNALDDTDWRVKFLGLPKPDDSFYYPGFNIGGPILFPRLNFNKNRDKLFFFFGFEKSIQNVQDPIQDIRESVTPTAAERTGNFSDTAYMANFASTAYYTSTTPTGKGIVNGVVQPTAIDPAGKILLNLFPLPNANPATNGGFNLVSAFTRSLPRNQELLRIDYNIDQRNHLSARFNHEGENVPFPFGFFNTSTLSPYPATALSQNHSNSITGNLATTFAPSLVNEFTATLTRLIYGFNTENEQAVSRSALNYPYPNLYNTGSDLIPDVSFGGNTDAASLYFAGGFSPNYNSDQQTIVINDSVTKTLRTHLLGAGFYFARQSFNKLTAGNDHGSVATEYYYSATGNSYADLLTGNIGEYSQSSPNLMGKMVQRRTDLFAEDSWKVNSKLTVNYGARLNHIGWWFDQEGRIVVFDPVLYDSASPLNQPTGFVSHATNPPTPRSGTQPLNFQFAPSGGFAYDIFGSGKTIVRGGFGTSYYIDPGTNAYSALESPPNENFTTIYAATTLSAVSSLSTASLYPVVYGTAGGGHEKLPVTYSYNLAFSHQLPSGIKVEAAYTGNEARNLLGYLPTNVVPEGCELPGGPGAAIGYAPGTYNDQLCGPYKNLQSVSLETHNLSSFYNSAQVTASKTTGPFNAWVTYTFGKTLGYNCENPFDERRCYNPVPFDQSQALNVSLIYNLPSVSAKYLGNHKPVNTLLDGWSISSIEQVASGSPLSFSANTNGNEYDGVHNRTIGFYGINDYSGGTTTYAQSFDPRTIVGTPDETAVPLLTCNPTRGLRKGQYFNPGCFQAPVAPVSGTTPFVGTYRLPYIHGPNVQSHEIGFYKTVKFTDSRNLQLRFQAFDYPNHAIPTFTTYDTALYLQYPGTQLLPSNSVGTGTPEAKTGARVIQLSAKFHF